jgi:membrane protease YdiL (CAAX protease family)
MNPNASSLLKQHPLMFFFLFAYGIAWAFLAYGLLSGKSLLVGISFFAPAAAAVIVTAASEGKAGLQTLISRLFVWRVPIKWYLIALLVPVALELLAVLTHALLGEPNPSFHFTDWIGELPAQLPWLAIFLLYLALVSAGEELGWRGYALPRLQARFGSVWASVILGTLWGLWHLPTFWTPGSPQYGLPVPGYVLASIGYTFIFLCIINGSKGSVLLACLYHAASNLILTYGNAIFPKVISDLYLSLPALAVVVLVVILLSGPGGLVRKQSLPDKEPA